MRKSQRRQHTAVRDRHNHVRIARFFQRQSAADRHARHVNALSEHMTVRTREIDLLEDALPVAVDRHIGETQAFHPVLVQLDQLAGVDIARKLRADLLQRARFTGHHMALAQTSQRKRTDSPRIARGVHATRTRDHKGKRAAEFSQRHPDAVALSEIGGVCKLVQQNLAVGRGLEDRALLLITVSQFARVDQIAVMSDRPHPVTAFSQKRLHVHGL